ncbi:hypothetical protein ZIOFF_025503 [Zingiber officinale]|uniref:Uncharacterized protein n=1 Tax=Zingiber officinale TaxID=94328 RepID=A0A8J5LJU6_ZINOF|nr:hypothetical protein ZIOFF_025503 [Zingiber officinale]
MIKRRFYRHEHVDRDGHSSSSSDSDSDSVSEDSSDSDADEDDEDGEDSEDEMQQRRFPFSGLICFSRISHLLAISFPLRDSPYSNVSSRLSILQRLYLLFNFLPCHISSEPIVGAEAKKYGTVNAGDISVDCNDPIQADLIFILKHKSVFKCRLCPKVICLSDETVKRHLSSKAHARFKKQFQVGTLKVMLNSDGEIEEEQETHAERYARIVALAKVLKSKQSFWKTEKPKEKRGKKRLKTENKEKPKEEKHEKKRAKTEENTQIPKVEKQEQKRPKTEGTDKPKEKKKKKERKTKG